MTDTHFQRARKPEEIETRRHALLAAAAELFDESGAAGTGLSAIAARAGFTKSNVYRYFESREQVLLQLFLAEFEAMTEALCKELATTAKDDRTALAETMTRAFVDRPRLGQLSAILTSVLEANVSEETIIDTKRRMGGLTKRLAEALNDRLPDASLADCLWALSMVGVLVAGMSPGAAPPPAAARVLAREEFAAFRPDLARDLGRAAEALLKAIG